MAASDKEPGGKPGWKVRFAGSVPGSGEAAGIGDCRAETGDTIHSHLKVPILFLVGKVIPRCPKLQNWCRMTLLGWRSWGEGKRARDRTLNGWQKAAPAV